MTKKKTTKRKSSSGLGKSKSAFKFDKLIGKLIYDLLIGKPEATKQQKRYYVFSEFMTVISLSLYGVCLASKLYYEALLIGLLGVYYFSTCLQFVIKFKSAHPFPCLLPKWLR